MKTLIKKEIRLLMPAWITAMLLAIVPRVLVIIWSETYHPGDSASYQVSLSFFMGLIFAGGVLFLGINSFGEELSCNTFSALLSQPIKRPRVWLIKVATLATAFISVWLAAILFVSWQFGVIDSWYPQLYLRPEFSDAFEFLTLSALVAFSGGLWTTLLLRQTTTAFWITLLMPLAVICGTSVVLHERIVQGQSIKTPVVVTLVLYSIAGFFVARKLFMRAQDVQWAGVGEISLPHRERTSKVGAGSISLRPRNWFSALAWKELQVHQGIFLIATIVLALHLTARFIRAFHPHFKNPDLEFLLDGIWVLWLIMPFLIGATAIAEERRMGTLEPQLCLPISRRAQLLVKFGIALALSLVFGALIPLLIQGSNMLDYWYQLFAPAAALFFVSFYASSLGRTSLQSIGWAILIWLALYTQEFVSTSIGQPRLYLNPQYYDPRREIEILIQYLDAAILIIVSGWLTFSNFKHVHQNWKFWVRNFLAILAAFVCVHWLDRAILLAWDQWFIRHYQ